MLSSIAHHGGSVLVYFAIRSLVALALGWHSSDMNLMSPRFALVLSFAQLAIWTACEGGWP